MASTSCRSLVTTLGGVAAGVTVDELIEKIFETVKRRWEGYKFFGTFKRRFVYM